MNNNKNRNLYISMIVGTIGIILIFLGIFEFFTIVESTKGYILMFIGFVITVQYIYHLERKVGLSEKVIWVRAIILILILFIAFYFLY